MAKKHSNISENIKVFDRYFNKGKVRILNEESRKQCEEIFQEGTKVSIEQKFPDYVILNCSEVIYGIEHFEFNSSLQGRKGSLLRQESQKAKRNHNNNVENNEEFVTTTHSQLMIESSSTNYFDNFIYGYEKHKKKIDKYKEVIKKEFDVSQEKIKLGFLIEDNTPTGVHRKDTDKILYPFNVTEIVEILENEKDLDFVIFSNYYEDTSYFISIKSMTEVTKTEKNISYKEIDIYENNPFQIDVSVLLQD